MSPSKLYQLNINYNKMQILNINSLLSNSDTFLELFITYKYITSCHSWQFLIRSWCKSSRLTCIDLIKELYICMSQHFCVGMCFCGTAATKEFQNFCDLKPYRLSLVLFYNILFYLKWLFYQILYIYVYSMVFVSTWNATQNDRWSWHHRVSMILYIQNPWLYTI